MPFVAHQQTFRGLEIADFAGYLVLSATPGSSSNRLEAPNE